MMIYLALLFCKDAAYVAEVNKVSMFFCHMDLYLH